MCVSGLWHRFKNVETGAWQIENFHYVAITNTSGHIHYFDFVFVYGSDHRNPFAHSCEGSSPRSRCQVDFSSGPSPGWQVAAFSLHPHTRCFSAVGPNPLSFYGHWSDQRPQWRPHFNLITSSKPYLLVLSYSEILVFSDFNTRVLGKDNLVCNIIYEQVLRYSPAFLDISLDRYQDAPKGE